MDHNVDALTVLDFRELRVLSDDVFLEPSRLVVDAFLVDVDMRRVFVEGNLGRAVQLTATESCLVVPGQGSDPNVEVDAVMMHNVLFTQVCLTTGTLLMELHDPRV